MSIIRNILPALMLTLATVAGAHCNETLIPYIASVQVTAGDNWLAPPIIQLDQQIPIVIAFDDMTHEYHRYTYAIQHCEADWQPSEGLFISDYLDGFYDGNTIDDYAESINTIDDYTHYRLEIPNDRCRLKMSGNYTVTIMDENDDNRPVLKVCFLVVEQKAGLAMEVTANTDRDIRGRHQQVEMNLNYSALGVTNPEEQITTVVMQNFRWDNAVINPRPTMISRDGLVWTHHRDLIFDSGNEFRKFETLDVTHSTMGIEEVGWDGEAYHAYVWPDEPRPNYVYDEDANGAYVVRNSDNMENETISEYVMTHFTLVAPRQPGEVYINGWWTSCPFKSDYLMTYNDEEQRYEATVKLKQGYYSYQYLLLRPDGTTTFVPTEGNFYQTENQYQGLVYFRSPVDRTDRLVGYGYTR